VKSPALECEQCGRRNIRRARFHNLSERFRAIAGVYPFRCRDCHHRFFAGVWLLSKMAYAKCPKCLRMDLSTWSRKHYNPGLLANFLITFGAQQYRCPQCRCNFVSFRPRRSFAATDEPLLPNA
jgi:ubiquitin C-terminal hydrolase